MKNISLFGMLIVIASFTGCGATKDAIKHNCTKTNLWVLSSGQSHTRQVYDCGNKNIPQLVRATK